MTTYISECCGADCRHDAEGRLVCDNCGEVCEAVPVPPTKREIREARDMRRAEEAGRD